MSKKRLSTIRKGIRYQDWIAAEAILDLLARKPDSPIWVEIEKPSSGKFDDVVVGYPGKVVHRQVKWAANPGAEPLAIDEFSKVSANRKVPLIKSYVESWALIQGNGQVFELEYLTNRSADSEFQQILNGSTSKIKIKLNSKQDSKLDITWRSLTSLNKTSFKRFCRSISFLVGSPSIEKQEEIVRAKLEALGGNRDDLSRLLDKIEDWSTDSSVGRLTAGMVERDLQLVPELPNNTFQLASIIAERNELRSELIQRIKKIKSGYLVVLGSPGSGKSTAINTIFGSDRVDHELDVCVYNCFTGTTDEFLRTRARHANFVAFLASELRRLRLTNQIKTDADSLERLLLIASKKLPADRKLVVVVDGLDYARRFASNNQPNLIDCLPPNLPRNVVIVVTAQVSQQLPQFLWKVAQKTHLLIPPLDQAKIKELVLKFGFESSESDNLVLKINSASRGHALYVSYALKYFKSKVALGEASASSMSVIPPFDNDISRYYSSIFEGSKPTLRDAIAAMASCPFQLSFAEIGSLMSPSVNAREVEGVFFEAMHLFERAGDYLQFTHDSLRVFALENHLKGKLSATDQVDFLLQLKDDPRPGEFLIPLLVETADCFRLEQIDFDWIVYQIMNGSDTALIHEGLTAAALFYLDKLDWRNTAKFWCLMACLERATFDGEFNETTLIRAWLDLEQIHLVKRYLFLGSRFLSVIYPSEQAMDLLEEYGYSDVAAQLRERETTQTPPNAMLAGHDLEFDDYVRKLALVADPTDVVDVLVERQEKMRMQRTGLNSHLMKTPESISKHTLLAAETCLERRDHARVQAWLDCKRAELGEKARANLFLKLHLDLDDLGQFKSAASALEHVDERWLLVEVAKKNIFIPELSSQFDRFYLPRLLRTDLKGQILFDQVGNMIHELNSDIWLSKKLRKTERLQSLLNGINSFEGPCARRFLELVFEVACLDVDSGTNWRPILAEFCDQLPVLRLNGNAFNNPEFEVTKTASCMIGHLIRPLINAAARNSETDELQAVIKENLIPTLERSRVKYTQALWGIAETLIEAKVSKSLAIELLQGIEKDLVEEWTYKSGAFISLVGSYARLKDYESSRRVFRLGLRASFSYGYRKDTTINEFIIAFDKIAPHLDDCLQVAEFITQVLVLLDTLTDLAMISDAASYFVAFLSKHNQNWALEAACLFEGKCRSLKCRSLLQAGSDEGIEVSDLAKRIRTRIPNVEFEVADPEANHRAYFVTSGRLYLETLSDLRNSCEGKISDSRYCKAFWSFASIIENLIGLGNTADAVKVFREFQNGLIALVDSYQMQEVSLSIPNHESVSENTAK
ncbi:hypothetical protein VN12_24345 [Pirellula sp. SH-Sr6A]|uniref:ATP-binding protein n=1 Tax=Pirellula sp. SH-Sr6A TaxID=1632865 RepID=UPI00078D6701|nr:ATP-binding protein [Pirellula sp. SH-Sr6A]AMV35278.1 hypothetical protein VN12_24345 [Pirellula sp. SH-Sr6A]